MQQQEIEKDIENTNNLKLYIQILVHKLLYIMYFIDLMKLLNNKQYVIDNQEPHKIYKELISIYNDLNNWEDNDWRFIINDCINTKLAYYRKIINISACSALYQIKQHYGQSLDDCKLFLKYSKQILEILTKEGIQNVEFAILSDCAKIYIRKNKKLIAKIYNENNCNIIDYILEEQDCAFIDQ